MNVNLQYVLDGVLGVALIAWICYRQMTWRVVDPARMWRGPLIFAIIGVGIIVTGSKSITLTPTDLGLLAVELVISLGVGATMGAIAHFRLLSRERAAAYEARRRPDRQAAAPVEYESRTSWVGVVLWIVMIAVRVGIEVFAQHLGGAATASTGIILLVLAANRAARTAVLAWRLEQHRQSIAALAR